MAASVTPKRPVRIGGASGGFTDQVAGIRRLAADPKVDAVVGDWLSENVMTGYGAGKARKVQSDKASTTLPLEERKKTAHYASTFLQCFEPAIPEIARNGAKLVVNAGASDTELLAEVVNDMVLGGGFDIKVAWVEGDDGLRFCTFDRNRSLVAQLGSFRFGRAGRSSGRWTPDRVLSFCHWCYYSRFKDLMKAKKHLDLGFPIAKVFSNGTCTITKEDMSNGIVNVETVTSQLVYEINGPLYFYSDVVAVLAGITLEQIVPCGSFGDTIEAPLGYIALGRSGDKASDANVGFFVSGAEEWDWLRSFLTANKIQELLGPEEYHSGRIDRFEMKNIRAVHFLLKDHLDRGYNSGSKLDTLAKYLCEYLRAKHVPIPREFLRKGHL
ncbi:hypothetical protein BN1723_006686 [Verticillium longisporum]|uniref:Uncharacterized protein n=1 Tax=Verticillium longisporum TaxID=100787 RepID=A0A0G4KD09_VERLO|nr:hypothetical protein BN1708_001958 [Verticillium longisporum]CRK45574.1 hypothetical protein BN1723_006686 [Verticillium longisporum]